MKPSRRLADRCDRTTIKDIMLPLLMLLLRRYRDEVSSVDEREHEIRKWLGATTSEKRKALLDILENYQGSAARTRECVFETRFDDWPDRCEINWEFVGKAFADQAAKSGREYLFDVQTGVPGRGVKRPWERPVVVGWGKEKLSVLTKPVKGPWPWICAVSTNANARQWYRNEQYRIPGNLPPGLIPYESHEIKKICKPPTQPGINWDCSPMTRRSTVPPGGFGVCPHGHSHTALINSVDTCLDVPKTYPGGPVTLRGLNFLSTTCRIRIQRLTSGYFDTSDAYEVELQPAVNADLSVKIPDIPCNEVFGDTAIPENVATCRVEDKAHFHMPSTYDVDGDKLTIPPGFYEIRLIVPNEEHFAFEALTGSGKQIVTPPELITNPAFVEVLPDPSLSYSLAIESGFCHEETSGPGSDEPWVTVWPFVFDKTSPITYPSTQYAIKADEIDTGDGIPLEASPFLLHQGPLSKLAPDYVPFLVTCGIVGFEVDSESDAKAQIEAARAAYAEFLKTVFLAGGAGSSLLDKGFAELDTLVSGNWTIASAGAAVVITTGGGLLWALWAPADPIISDLLIIDPIMAYALTSAGSSAPQIEPYSRDGIDVQVTILPPVPMSDTTTRFRFEHIYRSQEEESRYGLTYRIQRL
jgi:hypothetical protein